MKINYKVVAIADIILGIFSVLSSLIYPLFLVPLATRAHTDLNTIFNTGTQPSFTFTYLILGIIALMGVVDLFFGFKILTDKDKKYLTQGIYSAIITFVLSSVLFAIATLPLISSISGLILQP